MDPTTFQDDSLGWRIGQASQWLGEAWEWLFRNVDAERSPFPSELPEWLTQLVFWLVVAALATWGLTQLARWLPDWLSWGKRDGAVLLADRPEHASLSTWLARSRRAQQQGNYAEACRALYMAGLQHLNDGELIPQQASRTDGEYLALLQAARVRSPQAQQAYAILIATHERLHYSPTDASLEMLQACQQAFRTIEESPAL